MSRSAGAGTQRPEPDAQDRRGRRLDDVVDLIAPFRAFLQSASVAAPPDELFRLAGLLGQARRHTHLALGAMTAPEAGWHNDGRFNLLDLVTMTEIEHSAEAAAEKFAPYVD
jgi:hypothetical protein